MRAARYLPTRWALTKAFRDLSSDAQRLLFGLWIWPEMPTAGLSVTPPRHVGHAIGISDRHTDRAIAELHQSGFVQRDDEAAIIWLREYLETQLGRRPNAKDRAATAKTVRALPMTNMVRQFCLEYGITQADIDGLSYGLSDGVPHRVSAAHVTGHAMGANRLGKGKSLPVPSHPQSSNDCPPADDDREVSDE